MFNDVGGWVALVCAVVAAAAGWGQLYQRQASQGRAIKDLWDRKASAEDVRKNETKIDGLDHWGRQHEIEANKYRLEVAERFAKCEKSIEISLNNHQEMVRVIGRLEGALEKMENKFGALTQKMEEAIQRRRGNDPNK